MRDWRRLMLLLVGLLPLMGVAQSNFGGAQGVPPFPNQVGSNYALNPGFESGFAYWTTSSSTCLSIDNAVSRSGKSSAKMASCGSLTPLQQTVTIGSKEAVSVSFWVKTDSLFDGTLSVSFFDNTYGYGSVLEDTHEEMAVGSNLDWTQVQATLFNNIYIHVGDKLNVRVNLKGQSGTIWMDDFEMQDTWYPLRTFLKYPNYRGYLWDDKTQTISGVSVVNPPLGVLMNSTELSLSAATTRGCGSGVILSQVINLADFEVGATIPWTFDGTSLATGTTYYLCSSLVRINDGATLSQYNDWSIEKVSATFRSGLMNYFDVDGSWVHNGQRRLAFGTYDRFSSKYRCSGCLWYAATCPNQTTAEACYIYDINSMGYYSPLSQVLTMGSSVAADYQANSFDIIMGGITTFSAVNPTSAMDQLTPWLSVANEYGFNHAQILNNWYGSLVNETSQPGAPPAPTLSFSTVGGSISSPWVFVEISAATASAEGRGSLNLTLPSAAVANTNALIGTTNSLTVTLPECPNTRWLGFYVYAAVNSADAVPLNSDFGRQGNSKWFGCGTTAIFSSISNNGVNPPTTDTTIDTTRPWWQATTYTDPQGWSQVAQVMSNNPGAGAFYIADEPGILALGTQYHQAKTLAATAEGVPNWGVLVNSTDGGMWRDVLDVLGNDPYGYGVAASPDEIWAGVPRTGRPCTAYIGTANQVGLVQDCNVQRVDIWSDSLARDLYGSRPQWEVVQQFARGTVQALPYAEMRRQLYKALIGCQNWGSLGCGVLTWGWVDKVGMERAWFEDQNTQAYYDQVSLGSEIMANEQVWLSPTLDSSALGTGQVAASVSTSVSSSTVCGPGSGYANPAAYPYGPVRFVSKQMPNGDQWVFATNLCSSSSPFNVTFTLVNPPQSTVIVYAEGRTLPITTNQFTDTWQDADVHAYLISHATVIGPQ